MSDEIISEPQLVVPDPKKRIVSPREAARIADRNRKYDESGNRQIPPAADMRTSVTRADAMTHIATAVAESTRVCFEEMDEALGERLETMEHVIFRNVLLALERRTLRYRVTMWLRGVLTELGLIKPVRLAPVVDAVDVLDPNVRTYAAEEYVEAGMPQLVWKEFEKFSQAAMAHCEAGGIAIQEKPGGNGEGRIVAKDGVTLRRAGAMIGGENLGSIEDDTITLELDDVFMARARAIMNNGGVVPVGGWVTPGNTV